MYSLIFPPTAILVRPFSSVMYWSLSRYLSGRWAGERLGGLVEVVVGVEDGDAVGGRHRFLARGRGRRMAPSPGENVILASDRVAGKPCPGPS